VLALQTASDRQFYTRVLLAKLGELAVGELPLVDEIAKRSFGELDPVRTAARRDAPAPINGISVPRSAASLRPGGKGGIGSIISA
jgi:hypothetical protein